MTPAEFRPLPFLGNPHVQTILGTLLPGPECPPGDRHVVALPDGDAVLLHENTPSRWRAGGPVALVVHGMTGSHRSGHVQRLAVRLLRRGVKVYRIDLRGAGEGVRLARRTYHAGRSEDLREALAVIHARHPQSPLWLLALSLGGNMALRLAGEGQVPGLARLAVMNPPIDLARCSVLLERQENGFYERRFVRDLIANARQRQRHFPDLPPLALARSITLRQFDDLYTAPRNGFRDAAHYYGLASSCPVIPNIAVPTLILTARDDPFIDAVPFEELRVPPHVEVRITTHGGHIGYLGADGAGGIRWGERFAIDWLAGLTSSS